MSDDLVQRTVGIIKDAAHPVAAVLAMCEKAREALARAVSVTDARDVLAAISTLEHAIKVRDLSHEAVVAASTMRIRAERRVGELLAVQDMNKGGRPKPISDVDRFPTLEDQGITLNESSTFQRLASVSGGRFERALGNAARTATERKIAVTRESVMREIDPHAMRTPDDGWKDVDRFKTACDRVAELAPAAIEAIRWNHFPMIDDELAVERTALALSCRNARDAIARVEEATRRPRRKSV
jgi:hypothetical protein